MKSDLLTSVWTLLAIGALLVPGCGRDWLPEGAGACVFDSDCISGYVCFNGRCIKTDYGESDGGMRLKEFGERCDDNDECRSTYCLPHPQGGFCTRACDEGCPPSWSCRQVIDPHGGPTRLGLCAMDQGQLCRACASDSDCHPAGSDLCLQIGDGSYCAADCWYENCPAGYSCSDVEYSDQVLRQCIPGGGTCSCTTETDGMVRGCQRSSELGTCTGFETCDPPLGWTECSAHVPSQEICNGLDDDCNGLVDEDLEGQACSEENQYGSCPGVYECHALDGWVCSAQLPRPEDCDNYDNDCDGQIDEGFIDGQGRYVTDEHCGGCEIDCGVMIAHATRAECRLEDGEPVCRATACEDGYFVWREGIACLGLPDNLCQPCNTDQDCLAPGSACIVNGTEKYCGRDCSTASPYGPGCPQGYSCLSYSAGLQCQPENDTCLCAESTLGSVRSCRLDTCQGYQECVLIAGIFEWSACNVEDFNVEICDGLDNNCDGQIDEGFLNQATGRYESDEHCGFCNNDCGPYWSEPVDHTIGVCDVDAPGMPECIMGPCSTEVENGVQYEWLDVNGYFDDGCECRRVLGNTTSDLPDLIAEPEPGYEYLDENCDGIDGVVQDTLFVSAGAPPGGDGSLDHPLATLSAAIAAFASSGKSYILVAEGTYQESISLQPGVKLHGGYSADFKSRDVWLYQSVIQGQDADHTVQADGIVGVGTLLSGFVIRGRELSQAADVDHDGPASVAVVLRDCDDALVLRSNIMTGGRGADGGRGSSGQAGFGRQDSTALDGAAGLVGLRLSGNCSGTERAGGSAGVNADCSGSNGNPGGTTFCPQFDWNSYPYHGAQVQYGSDAGGNGLGGHDWSFDYMSGSSCSHATESGYPTEIELNVGQDGQDGADGTNGQGGAGGSGRYGSISGASWVAAPDGAGTGTPGADGGIAGGGGGGGGTARYYTGLGDCAMYEIGPSGGGGGAGGCGGWGGLPGRAGGASIVVLVSAAPGAPGTRPPELSHNLIERGQGGRGGDGGFGGIGGLGGGGGFGGGPPDWISSQAGKGGDGGNGGPGGGGGAAAGGPSFGVLGFNVAVDDYAANNTFVYDDSVPTGGSGGAGGISVGPGASGSIGLDGAFGNVLELTSCPAGGCPPGFACDSNNVCVPSN